MLVIDGSGLRKPRGQQLHIAPGQMFYLGASSSPDRVIVTCVEGERVYYRSFPYYKDHMCPLYAFRDLAEQGSRTEIPMLQKRAKLLETYGKPPGWVADEIARLEMALRGEAQEPIDVTLCQQVKCLIRYVGTDADDPWSHFEHTYGYSVSGMNTRNLTLDVYTTRRSAIELCHRLNCEHGSFEYVGGEDAE